MLGLVGDSTGGTRFKIMLRIKTVFGAARDGTLHHLACESKVGEDLLQGKLTARPGKNFIEGVDVFKVWRDAAAPVANTADLEEAHLVPDREVRQMVFHRPAVDIRA